MSPTFSHFWMLAVSISVLFGIAIEVRVLVKGLPREERKSMIQREED